MNNSSKSSIIVDYILTRILVTSCHFFREPPRAALAHNPPRLLSSRSPQSGASGRDLLRRDLGAPGAHEGRPHPLQPAVHDGKLGLQAGTASFDPPAHPLLNCAAASLQPNLRGHGVTASPWQDPGGFSGPGCLQQIGSHSQAAVPAAHYAKGGDARAPPAHIFLPLRVLEPH